MKKSTLNRFGALALGISMFLSFTPQVASAIPNCDPGDIEPGPYCLIMWQGDSAQATQSTFTIPDGATNVQAIIVGAGSGAFFLNASTPYTTFSGNSGKVRYADLSAVPAGTVLNLVAGRSGDRRYDNIAARPGGDSSISYGSTTLVAEGGVLPTETDSTCTISVTIGGTTTVDPAHTRQGSSAKGDSPVSGGICGELAQGVDPAVDTDSYGNAVLSLFDSSKRPANYGQRLANAGGLDVSAPPMAQATRVRTPGIGDGGSLAVDLRNSAEGRPLEGGYGGVGAIFIRWIPTSGTSGNSGGSSGSGGITGGVPVNEAGSTLASTGSEDTQLAWWATGVIAFGLAVINFMPRGRRRSKTSPKH